jgi:hypothetical protein
MPDPPVEVWKAAQARWAAKGQDKQLPLTVAVKMWPTPTIDGNYNRAGASPKSGDGLATAVGGSLNPTFVEWMMGLPRDWTEV